MRKMKLDLDQLAVESFETCTARGQGTVYGQMPELDVRPNVINVDGQYLAANTYPECPSPLCVDTPLASCDGSCRPGCVANGTVAADPGAIG
jgi:hypothetical protein